MIGRLIDWFHELRHGHRPAWHVAGYDGLELDWGCIACDPDLDWDLWHTKSCDCPTKDSGKIYA